VSSHGDSFYQEVRLNSTTSPATGETGRGGFRRIIGHHIGVLASVQRLPMQLVFVPVTSFRLFSINWMAAKLLRRQSACRGPFKCRSISCHSTRFRTGRFVPMLGIQTYNKGTCVPACILGNDTTICKTFVASSEGGRVLEYRLVGTTKYLF
jgi:hypothetical protein